MRRLAAEVAGTLACMAAIGLYMQLRDPTSRPRLLIAEYREVVREWSIRTRAEHLTGRLLDDVSREVE